MQGTVWVHGITLSICVTAFVCTLSFFTSQPLLPEPVFIAVLATAVAWVIASIGVWLHERLDTAIQEMEERLHASLNARR